jgi:hypothetical protein
MKKLVNQVILDFESLVPGSCSIKGSFAKESLIYLVCGVSKKHSIPCILSSYPTFHEAKEAISQITLAMDKILISEIQHF